VGVTTVRSALRGDCHVHTDWSDGGHSLAEMVRAAAEQGHDYVAITDHSPRLTIAHGLTAQRLRKQLAEIEEINAALAGTGFRVLTGAEVDILADGSLDQDPDLLAQLDLVIGSVHSGLRDDKGTMTRRMLTALANPNLDILGHCTGRKLRVRTDEAHAAARWRPPSTFDVAAVVAAAVRYDKAIEINCRPDRRDPPTSMLERFTRAGDLLFSIDSDAHATEQLAWLEIGSQRADEAGIPLDRIVNTLGADDLLDWCASHG
jgi:putative hydrolase